MKTRFLLAAILSLFGLLVVQAQNDRQKNVLLIIVDDLTAQPGVQPAVQTPHMDRLKQKGVHFTQAHAAVPLCNPSRTAFLTGLAPWQTQIFSNSQEFRKTKGYQNAITLPQFFKNQGYISFATGKIFHHSLGERSDPLSWTQNATQVDVLYGSEENQAIPVAGTGGALSAYEEQVPLAWGQLDKKTGEMDDWKNVTQAVQFLEKQTPGDSAFFLACGIVRPHLPHFYPSDFAGVYQDLQLPAYLAAGSNVPDILDCPHSGNSVLDSLLALPDGQLQWKQAVQSYLRCMAFADYCVGAVIDAYEGLPEPVRQNTLVVLIGDHGYHLGQKSAWAKVSSAKAPMVWDQTTHTQMVIYDPKYPEAGGKTVAAPVSLLDLYPTVLELSGTPASSYPDNDPFSSRKIWGESLAKAVVSGTPETVPGYALSVMAGNVVSLRSPDWRYIYYPFLKKGELYYHGPAREGRTPDPEELQNLLHPDQVTPFYLKTARKMKGIANQLKKGKRLVF
ncbi:MAG: sulfatase-like hydrolase/transferase [Haliscomenobacter sp.]|nr:sulfatase-like hydrolase/transferase [Haliscomenobacter sp.]